MTAIGDADEQLLLWINELVGQWSVLDSFMRVVVNDYFIPVSLSLILVAIWFVGKDRLEREQNQRAVICTAGGIGIACGIVKIFNVFFDTLRPFERTPELLDTANRIFYCPTDSSFPCNAAAVTFAVGAGVWVRNHKLGTLAFLGAFLMCFARVYAAVHYPFDVLAGAAIGIVSVYVTYQLLLPLFDPMVRRLLKLGRKLCLV